MPPAKPITTTPGNRAMLRRLQLRHLTHFIQVAREGAVRKAALTLNISQPAVTRSIKELEQILGLRVFERSRRGVALNANGQSLLLHAERAMAELNAASAVLDALKLGEQGRVVIGGPTVGISLLVPKAAARMKRRLPHVSISVVPGPHERLLPLLRVGEIDLFFGRKGTAPQMVGLTFKRLFQDRLVIVARPKHAFVGRRDTSLADLAGLPWLVPLADASFTNYLAGIFSRSNLDLPKNRVEMTFGLSMWTYMDETDAVAAMPSNLISGEIRAGRLAIIKSEPGWVLPPFGICHRSEHSLTAPARLLLNELVHVAAQRRQEVKHMLSALDLSLSDDAG
jgi:DNA-binding transcriptional LysR family regulator